MRFFFISNTAISFFAMQAEFQISSECFVGLARAVSLIIVREASVTDLLAVEMLTLDNVYY
jgi:hypothetical protein